MENALSLKFSQFLKSHYTQNVSPLLILGFSGGSDSLALFHLLKTHRIPFIAAHIDHGWREESFEEAKYLSQYCKEANIPFYLKRLDPTHLSGNLEAACRKERLLFFKELWIKHKAQAVLLGHHVQDVAETVLKRFFEGASLTYLHGIKQTMYLENVPIWRPLIKATKKEILDYISLHQLSPIEDRTNLEEHYLRGRLRKSIFPFLNKQFGKDITNPLCHISQEAEELHTYLEAMIKPYLNNWQKGVLGNVLNLSESCPKHLFELKHLIRIFCHHFQITLSHALTHKLAEMITTNVANRHVEIGSQKIYIDRKKIFILSKDWGEWQQTLSNQTSILTGWQQVLKGECCVALPSTECYLSPPIIQEQYQKKTLDRWWSEHKVPAFLRPLIPVVKWKDQIVHEFLTGKYFYPESLIFLKIRSY